MSIAEPGCPYFMLDGVPRKDQPFKGARLTNKGNYRMFPISIDSPHEPWCLHFEWGPCSCGPEPGEEFVHVPWWKRIKL